MVTTSPVFAARAGSGVFNVACCWRTSSSCSSTIASVTSAFGRLMSKPSCFTSATSGVTSKRATYENASFASTFARLHARLRDRNHVVLRERLRQRRLHERVHHVAHHLRAVHALQHVTRRLAGTEPADARVLREHLVRLVDLALHCFGRHLDRKLEHHGGNAFRADLHGKRAPYRAPPIDQASAAFPRSLRAQEKAPIGGDRWGRERAAVGRRRRRVKF